MKSKMKMYSLLIGMMIVAALFMVFNPLNVNAATVKPTKITLSATATNIAINEKIKITVKSVSPKNASKSVTYKTSNKKIATVSQSGVVKGKKEGTVKITVTSTKNKKVTASKTIKVYKVRPTKIQINERPEFDIYRGYTKQLYSKITPSNLKCSTIWKSNNPSVVSISKTGKITAMDVGTATITAQTSEKAANGKYLTTTCKIHVVIPKKTVTSSVYASLDKNGTLTLGASRLADTANTLKNFGKVSINDRDMLYATESYSENIKKVVIKDPIALSNCRSLFKGLTNLETIENMENLDTSECRKMDGMFADCKNLKSIDLSHLITVRVSGMDKMFYNCSSLTNLDVSHFNTMYVSSMASMFEGCSELKEINLTKFNAQKLLYMNRMFAECRKLETVKLNASDTKKSSTKSVRDYTSMFENCFKLDKLDITNFIFNEKARTKDMFKNTIGLKQIMVDSSFDKSLVSDTVKITEVDNAIGGIDIDKNKTDVLYASLDENGELTLSSREIPNTDITLKNFGKIDLIKTPSTSDSGFTGLEYSKDPEYRNQVKTINIKDKITLTSCRELFANLENLTTIKNLENLDTSKCKSMSKMFYGCSSLTTLDVSKFNTSNVTDMSQMFSDCSSLTTLDVSKFDTSNVTNMHGMFEYCSLLATLDVSNFNTLNVTDMCSMFQYCQSLTTLDLRKFNTKNVKYMSAMFYNCKSLKTLDLSNFNTTNVTTMNYMFKNCSSLKTLDISYFIFTNEITTEKMFEDTPSLIEIKVTKSFDKSLVSNSVKIIVVDHAIGGVDIE